MTVELPAEELAKLKSTQLQVDKIIAALGALGLSRIGKLLTADRQDKEKEENP